MSNTVDLLPANLQSTLFEVVERANAAGGGILAILLSTAEGVPLGRVYANQTTPLNEDILSSIESTWAPAPKSTPLLGLGKEARMATAISDHGKFIDDTPSTPTGFAQSTPTYCFILKGTIIHVYQAPVVSIAMLSSIIYCRLLCLTNLMLPSSLGCNCTC